MIPSIPQIRAARALLDWSQSDLADYANLSQTGIARIENGTNKPNSQTIEKIFSAFEYADIEFHGEFGVSKRSGQIKTLKGQDGFNKFYQNVYKELAKNPTEVCLSNVDERDFEKWLGPKLQEHVEKILTMDKVTYKILIQEGDTHFITSEFSEYRWMPEKYFSSVPFYIYGKKLAIIVFDEEPTILILDYPEVAAAYRKQFQAFWSEAKLPHKKAS